MMFFRRLSFLWFKVRQKFLQGKVVRGSHIDPSSTVQSGSQFVNSTMGRHSYCAYDCLILNCSIGNFCSLAPEVVIGVAQHPLDWASTSPAFEGVRNSSPRKRFSLFPLDPPLHTTIGADVWIGQRAIIKGGVTIGHGAVIGAGAVVTKDVPPYAIVGGCPARVLRFRFDSETIDALLRSEWWTLSDSEITMIAQDVRTPMLFAEKAIRLAENRQITPPNCRRDEVDATLGNSLAERSAA